MVRRIKLEPDSERACKLNRNLGIILKVVFRELKILFRNAGLGRQLIPHMCGALSSVLSAINKTKKHSRKQVPDRPPLRQCAERAWVGEGVDRAACGAV